MRAVVMGLVWCLCFAAQPPAQAVTREKTRFAQILFQPDDGDTHVVGFVVKVGTVKRCRADRTITVTENDGGATFGTGQTEPDGWVEISGSGDFGFYTFTVDKVRRGSTVCLGKTTERFAGFFG